MSSDVLEASRERRLAELEFVEAAYPDAAIDYAPGMSDGAGFSFWVRMEYDAAVVDHLDSSSDDDYAPKIAAPLPHVPCLIEENIVKLTVRMPLLYPEECGPEVSLSEWQPLKMVETANDGVTQAALALNGFKTSDRVRVVNEDERGKVLERLKTEAAEAPGEERSLQLLMAAEEAVEAAVSHTCAHVEAVHFQVATMTDIISESILEQQQQSNQTQEQEAQEQEAGKETQEPKAGACRVLANVVAKRAAAAAIVAADIAAAAAVPKSWQWHVLKQAQKREWEQECKERQTRKEEHKQQKGEEKNHKEDEEDEDEAVRNLMSTDAPLLEALFGNEVCMLQLVRCLGDCAVGRLLRVCKLWCSFGNDMLFYHLCAIAYPRFIAQREFVERNGGRGRGRGRGRGQEQAESDTALAAAAAVAAFEPATQLQLQLQLPSQLVAVRPKRWPTWRDMRMGRPCVRTDGTYVLKTSHLRAPVRDMWTELPEGTQYLETVYYRYIRFYRSPAHDSGGSSSCGGGSCGNGSGSDCRRSSNMPVCSVNPDGGITLTEGGDVLYTILTLPPEQALVGIKEAALRLQHVDAYRESEIRKHNMNMSVMRTATIPGSRRSAHVPTASGGHGISLSASASASASASERAAEAAALFGAGSKLCKRVIRGIYSVDAANASIGGNGSGSGGGGSGAVANGSGSRAAAFSEYALEAAIAAADDPSLSVREKIMMKKKANELKVRAAQAAANGSGPGGSKKGKNEKNRKKGKGGKGGKKASKLHAAVRGLAGSTEKKRSRGPVINVQVQHPHAIVAFRFAMLSLRGDGSEKEEESGKSTNVGASTARVKDEEDNSNRNSNSKAKGKGQGEGKGKGKGSATYPKLFVADRLLLLEHTCTSTAGLGPGRGVDHHNHEAESLLADGYGRKASLDVREEEFIFMPDDRPLMKRVVLPYDKIRTELEEQEDEVEFVVDSK